MNIENILISISAIAILTGLYFWQRSFIKKMKIKKDFPETATGNKEIISPEPARYDYVFSNGIKCFQEELTLQQDKRIAELITSLNIKDFAELKAAQLIELLSKNELLEKFLHIIFHVNYLPQGRNFSQLRNSELERVFTDFFFLNPTAKKLLQILNVAAVFARPEMEAAVNQSNTKPVK